MREEDGISVEPDDQGDLCGHGNACAESWHSPPDCECTACVCWAGLRGRGRGSVSRVSRHAVQERYDVINLSLSTTNPEWCAGLHSWSTRGCFNGR